MSDAHDAAIQEIMSRLDRALEKAEYVAANGENSCRETQRDFSLLNSRIHQELQRRQSEILGLQATISDLENRLKLKDIEIRENSRVLRSQFGDFYDRELSTQAAQLSQHYEKSIANLEDELARRDQIILDLQRLNDGSKSKGSKRTNTLALIPGIWGTPRRDQ